MRCAVLANWGVGARMLELLLELTDVAFVVTASDAASKDPWRNAVKHTARNRGVNVLDERDFSWMALDSDIRDQEVEVVFMHAFLHLVPETSLAVPPLGYVNLHASLLPRHKGRDPVRMALAAGDCESGLTTHLVTPELDAGPVVYQAAFELSVDENVADVLEKQKQLLPLVMRETVARLGSPRFEPTPQQQLRGGMQHL